MRIVGLGHGLFAIAGAGLAVLSLTYRDFAPIWRPLPAWIPWRETWVYGSGLLVLGASAGLWFARTALPSALMIGTYLAVWAVTRAAPVVFKPLSVGSWYGLCEALGPLLGAWILYATLRWPSRVPETPLIASERAVRAAQVLFGTLEALMMSLFGLLVWVPSLFMQPPPEWATPPRNQWSELFVTLLLAASAWIVATSLQNRPWGFASRSRTHRDASDLL